MALTPAMFVKAGEALYGPCWRLPLSGALAIGERTVRRWQARGATIPAGIEQRMAVLCRKHAADLGKIADQLEGNDK